MANKKLKKVSPNITPVEVTDQHFKILETMAKGILLSNAAANLLEDDLPEGHFKASEMRFAYNELVRAIQLYETRMRKNADILYRMFPEDVDAVYEISKIVVNDIRKLELNLQFRSQEDKPQQD